MRTSIYLALALAMGYVHAENLFDIAQDEENYQTLEAEAEPERRMLQRQRRCRFPMRCYWGGSEFR